MRLRRVGVLVFVFLAASAGLGPALAGSGKANDPAGDVMDGETNARGAGKLDIVSNAHSDDGVRITYVLTTKDPFDARDVFLINWALYDLDGVKEWDCAPISVGVRLKGGAFDGNVERCNGSGGGGSGGPGGQQVLAEAEVVHAAGSNTIRVSYAIAALRRAGFTGTTTHYRAFTRDDGGDSDMLPDTDPTITHQLSSPPPTPIAATPVPVVPPAIIPTPSPEPTVKPSPGPTVRAESFSAPESREEDTSAGASVPVKTAAVGTVVLAATGAALLTFRPS